MLTGPSRIGLVSYSAYLWHQPLLAFARHASEDEADCGHDGRPRRSVAAPGSGQWRWVEVPARERVLPMSKTTRRMYEQKERKKETGSRL